MNRRRLILVLTVSCIVFLVWDIVTEFPEKGALRSAGNAVYVFLLGFLIIWHQRNERKAMAKNDEARKRLEGDQG